MRRCQAPGCSVDLSGKSSTAKFCSDRCRKRVQRNPAAKAARKRSGTLAKTVRAELTRVRAQNTVPGQLAIDLAKQIDRGEIAGAAMAGAARQLDALVDKAAAAGRSADVDPIDELRARRERKLVAG